MARARQISGEMGSDSKICDLSPDQAFPLVIAMVKADRCGLLSGDPREFMLRVCPVVREWGWSTDRVMEMFAAWAAAGIITMYESDAGPVLHFVNFNRHQGLDGSKVPHWFKCEAPSKFPAPPGYEFGPNLFRKSGKDTRDVGPGPLRKSGPKSRPVATSRDKTRQDAAGRVKGREGKGREGKGREEKGREEKGGDAPPPFPRGSEWHLVELYQIAHKVWFAHREQLAPGAGAGHMQKPKQIMLGSRILKLSDELDRDPGEVAAEIAEALCADPYWSDSDRALGRTMQPVLSQFDDSADVVRGTKRADRKVGRIEPTKEWHATDPSVLF